MESVLVTNNKQELPVNKIAFSPLNYRKWYDQDALALFAEELAQHGILSPILLRPVKKGFELVAGERRLRAAQMIGLEVLG